MTTRLPDEIDRHLIALLTANARAPVASLAAQLGMARTTVQARLERLERAGIIAGYAVRLSETHRAGQIAATVLVQVNARATPSLIAMLNKIAEVERVHTTSGRFDLIIGLRCDTTVRLDALLDRIGAMDGVKASESLIHLSTRIDRGQ